MREFSARPEILEPLFAPSLPPASGKAGDGMSTSRQVADEIAAGQAGAWIDTWVKPKAYEEPVPEITYDANKARAIASQASKGGSWDVDIFSLEASLADETVPYRPAMLLVADEETGFLLHTELAKP